jgi:hypothetical protein
MRNLAVRYEEAAPRYEGPAVRSEEPGLVGRSILLVKRLRGTWRFVGRDLRSVQRRLRLVGMSIRLVKRNQRFVGRVLRSVQRNLAVCWEEHAAR